MFLRLFPRNEEYTSGSNVPRGTRVGTLHKKRERVQNTPLSMCPWGSVCFVRHQPTIGPESFLGAENSREESAKVVAVLQLVAAINADART
jgi:hypothetical protein